MSRLAIPDPVARSGRPAPGEYADYAQADFDFVEGDDAVAALASAAGETLDLLEPLGDGAVNGYRASTRGLAFHIAAHELHHLRVLRERYLPKLG